MRPRSPSRCDSEVTTAPNSERGSVVTRSRSSSPDVEIAVRTDRAMSTASDSSTEAVVDRMVPHQPLPKIVPSSSWTPHGSRSTSVPTVANAVHVDTYRPYPRPSNPSLPFGSAPVARHGPSAPGKQRQRRDVDRAPKGAPEVLNYGDDASGSSTTATTTPTQELDQSQAEQRRVDISENRRRVLESMRKRKTAPSLPPPAVAATTPTSLDRDVLDEAAKLEREILGSTAEVPMDIDDEVEDGEIADDEPPPTALPSPIPISRAPSRGVKRPHAEDMMDNPSRPTSAQRVLPSKRRLFGALAHQRPNRLIVALDDDDDSDSSDEEEEPTAIHTPVIVIPPPIGKATAIAEKEERIRLLKEQIEARLASQRASASAPPSGAATPTTESRVAEATKAAVGVGGDNVAREDVDAALEAVVHDEQAAKQGWPLLICC